jgi:hypothetical protein
VAPTGPYLAKIGKAEDDKCWWCGNGASQTREHLFKQRWKDQQVIMWRAIGKVTGRKRTARNTSMAQLFGDERCASAILEFLGTMEVGLRGGRRLAGGEDDGEERPGGEDDDEDDDEGGKSEGWEGDAEGG